MGTTKKKIDITTEDLNVILSFFKPLNQSKNDILLSLGQTRRQTFFVGKGCLRIFFINEEGKDVTRYISFENQLATALVSFIIKLPSIEYIQVLEKSKL